MNLHLFGKDQATGYDDWYETPWGRYADQREKQLLLRLAAPQAGERVLDVGCGTGRYLSWLREMGLEVVNVEPSPAMAEVSHQRLGLRIIARGAIFLRLSDQAVVPEKPQSSTDTPVIIADGHRLPFADNSFDLVITITATEFAVGLQRMLAEMARVSRSRIFLGVLNRVSFYHI